MNSDSRATETRLQSALRSLEQQLETPGLPGELLDWAESVEKASLETAEAFRNAEGRHPGLFDEIMEQDAALGPQIENLRAQDETLTERVVQFQQDAKKLVKAARGIHHDEKRLEKAREELAEAGLALVIDIRKQETALATWLSEAFQRDRGVAD